MDRYWKLILYVAVAVVGGTGAALFTDGGWNRPVLINAAVLAVSAAIVFWQKNTPAQPWAKAVVAVLGAAVTVLVASWTDRRIDPGEWQQIILAGLGAASLAAVANTPTPASLVVVTDVPPVTGGLPPAPPGPPDRDTRQR